MRNPGRIKIPKTKIVERLKHPPIPKSKKERIGIPTGLLDCNGNEIITGSYYKFANSHIAGPVLWNRNQDRFGIFYGLWYDDRDPMNPDAYGKFTYINPDQGMRMELIPISKEEAYDSDMGR